MSETFHESRTAASQEALGQQDRCRAIGPRERDGQGSAQEDDQETAVGHDEKGAGGGKAETRFSFGLAERKRQCTR